jgi:hypothetical protein
VMFSVLAVPFSNTILFTGAWSIFDKSYKIQMRSHFSVKCSLFIPQRYHNFST